MKHATPCVIVRRLVVSCPDPSRRGKGSGDYCAFSCLCRVSSLVFETTNQIAGFKYIMQHKASMNRRLVPYSRGAREGSGNETSRLDAFFRTRNKALNPTN